MLVLYYLSTAGRIVLTDCLIDPMPGSARARTDSRHSLFDVVNDILTQKRWVNRVDSAKACTSMYDTRHVKT